MAFAVIDKSTGRLVSLASEVAPTLPKGLQALAIGAKLPNLAEVVWDEAGRSFSPRPARVVRDRVEDIMGALAGASLNEGAREAVRQAAAAALPPESRYY